MNLIAKLYSPALHRIVTWTLFGAACTAMIAALSAGAAVLLVDVIDFG